MVAIIGRRETFLASSVQRPRMPRKPLQCAGWLQSREEHSALERKEIVTHDAARMDLDDMVLSERSQSQNSNDVGFHLRDGPRGVRDRK